MNRDKTLACWLGKAIGGTLGQPHEGKDGPLDLTFYDPVPEEAIPNDDLDLQVVWAMALAGEDRPRVDRNLLARAWQQHVTFPWDEYGAGLRNLANAIAPPLSGQYDNWFAECMGAAIRSELWACLAPGRADLAAAYAYEDACVDHAGEGVWAEVFHAALQSLAFVKSNPEALLDEALTFLPPRSRVRRAIQDTRARWALSGDWRAVREHIQTSYGHPNFTDVAQNLAFTVLGWLAGQGDFGKSLCIAVNCGKDTDCTGATLGALLGIIDPACIPDRWAEPIGRALILSPGIVGLDPPKTIDDFTDLVLDLAGRIDPPAESVGLPDVLPRLCPTMAGALTRIPATIWQESFDATAEPTPPATAEQVTLPGHWITDKRLRGGLAIRCAMRLGRSGEVHVMASTWGKARAWVDGKQVLQRTEPGLMMPSYHRAAPGTRGTVDLPPGEHVLTVVAQVPEPHPPELVIGVGQAATNLWLPDALTDPCQA
ncbi:MAG: ADP-ribosylglycohydrolase family protein [Phycisphaerae bacterium]|nr:ADP-ribosylglycohydrolase family protein [Phycisphaerae bacterium]